MRKFSKSWGLTSVCLAAWCCVSGAAWGQTGERFGSVQKVYGSVTATHPVTGAKRELKEGDTVLVGEKIQASSTGEAVLRTDDAGVIAVRPNAQFSMEQFSARKAPDDKQGLRIFSGSLRLITGWVGTLKNDAYQVFTPTTVMGLRGTDHEPYVLSSDLAAQLKEPEGTYDKVNRGGTFIDAGGIQLDVDAGRVGFSPAPRPGRHRALITALMPYLLDKVPGFYVPGRFDGDLDSYAAAELERAMPGLAAASKPAAAPPPPAPAGNVSAALAQASDEDPSLPAGCKPNQTARQWLAALDGAIIERNAERFVAMFDPKVEITAKVKGGKGALVELKLTHSDLETSTFAALSSLSEYTTRRPVTKAALAKDSSACTRIEIESIVMESGKRNGGTYRMETLEGYTLELQNGTWRAVKASTTQR